MRWFHLLAGLVIVGAAAAVGLLIAEEPQTRWRHFPEGDVQSFPQGINPQRSAHHGVAQARHPVLGQLLFSDVAYVQFMGPGQPANSDGSLVALVVGEEGGQLTIYERYIVRDVADAQGLTFRTLYPYDKLGRIE